MEAIIYTTNTGSTQRYAQLLAEETGLPVPSIDKSTHGFGGQGGAHVASKPLKIRKYFPRPFHCLSTALTAKTAEHPTAMDFRVIFGF